MPELPEVEVVRRQLEPLLAGRTVTSAWAQPSPRFAAAELAVGLTIGAVERRGKYLLLRGHVTQGDANTLVVHLGMTGSLAITDGEPVASTYLRACWGLGGRTLTYADVRQFGRIAWVTGDDYSSVATLAAMGPEPLDETFTADALWRNTRRSRQRIKTQLLSQRPVAGIGNIYADEALHAARINPAVRRISRAQAARLLAELRRLLTASIERGGTTLRDYTSLAGSGDNQHHLVCYGRAGLPCTACGTELRRRVYDGRSTVLCPACQRR